MIIKRERTLLITYGMYQKEQQKLSEPEKVVIYRQRKIDVEPVFRCLKANLGFTRCSIRGKTKVKNEIGLALMATNLRRYTRRGA